MKISLLEPIGVSQAVLDELSQGLKDRVMNFVIMIQKQRMQRN